MKYNNMIIFTNFFIILYVLIFLWYRNKKYPDDPVEKYFREKPPIPINIEIIY
jgi:hypothetical protein